MIEIEIPGYKTIHAEHLVLDFNGTLAVDGHLIEGVADRLLQLGADLDVTVLTPDTFGTVRKELKDQPVTFKILDQDGQDGQKARYVKQLGADRVIAVGNGRNDMLMLQEAAGGHPAELNHCFIESHTSETNDHLLHRANLFFRDGKQVNTRW